MASAAAPTPTAGPFRFEYSKEAAEFNSEVFRRAGYDLATIIRSSPGSTISYGSELRPLSQVSALLSHQPLFDRFRSNHTNGIRYAFKTEMEDDNRLRILHATIERGNHKSALAPEARPHVTKSMKSVDYGFAIPISVDCIPKIAGAEVYPLGLQQQTTIDEQGQPIPKWRVTHDLSHNRATGESINQRVDTSDLPEQQYGHALLRFVHLIHSIRRHFPHDRILCNKFDIEKAYRRLHTCAETASKCIAIWYLDKLDGVHYELSEEKIGSLLLRLPFGASPAPPQFCVTSEIVFDLAGDLAQCNEWDPNQLASPYAAQLPEPERLPDDVPFGQAEEAAVQVDPSCNSGIEGYIDDGLGRKFSYGCPCPPSSADGTTSRFSSARWNRRAHQPP